MLRSEFSVGIGRPTELIPWSRFVAWLSGPLLCSYPSTRVPFSPFLARLHLFVCGRQLCVSDVTEILEEELTATSNDGNAPPSPTTTSTMATTTSSSSKTISKTSSSTNVPPPSSAGTPSGGVSISRPSVRMLNGGAAVSSFERSRGPGHAGGDGGSGSGSAISGSGTVLETRVWEMREGGWKCVHCHTSQSRR